MLTGSSRKNETWSNIATRSSSNKKKRKIKTSKISLLANLKKNAALFRARSQPDSQPEATTLDKETSQLVAVAIELYGALSLSQPIATTLLQATTQPEHINPPI